jgi:fermentation-respiration switch protein FrsA (DUF1100 family)
VTCPVLALNGAKDLQVDARVNLQAIQAALKEGGNKDVICRELPNLNHLFQTCKTGSVSEYGAIEDTLAPGSCSEPAVRESPERREGRNPAAVNWVEKPQASWASPIRPPPTTNRNVASCRAA